MNVVINIPTLRKRRLSQIKFYTELFDFCYCETNTFTHPDISGRIRLSLCNHITNGYTNNNKNEENWIPIFQFNFEKNLPSLLIQLENKGSKIISAVRFYGAYQVKFLDPSGNILSVYCENSDDENNNIFPKDIFIDIS